MSKTLSLVVLFVVVATLALIGAACGDSQPSAPSSVSTRPSWPADVASLDQPRLLDLHDFTLDGRRPTRAFVRLDSAQRLRIGVLVKQPLQACRLSQYADAGGGVIDSRRFALAGGRLPNDDSLIRYSFTTPRLQLGYYRIDLRGKGLVLSFAVDPLP